MILILHWVENRLIPAQVPGGGLGHASVTESVPYSLGSLCWMPFLQPMLLLGGKEVDFSWRIWSGAHPKQVQKFSACLLWCLLLVATSQESGNLLTGGVLKGVI